MLFKELLLLALVANLFRQLIRLSYYGALWERPMGFFFLNLDQRFKISFVYLSWFKTNCWQQEARHWLILMAHFEHEVLSWAKINLDIPSILAMADLTCLNRGRSAYLMPPPTDTCHYVATCRVPFDICCHEMLSLCHNSHVCSVHKLQNTIKTEK